MIEIQVPIARVWRALTDPALIKIWAGQDAEVDARQGGMYRIGRRQVGAREAHIDVFEVNRRLRLIYLSSPEWPPSDSATVDDFIMDMRPGETKTQLRLLGSGIPEDPAWDQSYVRLRMGWERFLARIKVALESPPRPKQEKKIEPKDPPLPGLDY
jgi:uncharacterized protein YndB with AHSA1/START domain